ncbi:hypothetical protein [Campylobacter sp. MG1]|uniref:hypothetical protein n=1 Tax=Campylobacter sp. MG1 TaxID=2976332 RepID=UPI00226D2B35|nr:hypothetical protein [Campylobacter sp. MG1]
MNKYSISDDDLIYCQKKLLKTFTFQKCAKLKNNSNDEKLSIFDISYNANINIKYSYELLNIIDLYGSYNQCILTYIPIFITITLDGCYRRMLKGDYKEFNETRLNNEIPKYLRYKYDLKKPLNIKDCYNILNYQHKKMRDRYLNKYKNICHDFIKVPEPHKNGVPHLHCLWFVPNDENLIKYLRKIFKECCPAPQNHTQKGLSKEQILKGDTQGFQTNINDTCAYITKYIFKTFRNIHNKDYKINKLHAWYINYKIRRFTRSHLKTCNNYRFPIIVYRKIRHHLINLGYKDLSDCFFAFFSNEKCFINYNLNRKKGDIYINISLLGKTISYTKQQTIINHYGDNNKIYKQDIIKNNTYVLDYDKNLNKDVYDIYYHSFVS